MSLKIANLSKIYGKQKALDSISFEVAAGEIVGFLGPNGAGKSTTMKIATGYIPPTKGEVFVGGYDVVSQALEVKKIIGYLPEHNPLYLDMYVHEYLSFIGKLYDIKGKQLSLKVGEMVERCGLQREQNKKISALSKGYRQRVGLAQALIHDPKILILDEPTTGLDPNQLVEIRKLIREVSIHKTVIFSTHIMQEVQALCNRVVLINKGRIVADDSIDSLMGRKKSAVSLIVEFDGEVSMAKLQSLPFVVELVRLTDKSFRITAAAGKDVRPDIFRFAADNNLSLVGLRQEENSLESVFQELTK